MDLVPAVILVIDSSTDDGDVLANRWDWHIWLIHRDDFDHEVSILIFRVARAKEVRVLRVDFEPDVIVVIGFMLNPHYSPGSGLAGIEKRKSVGMVDTSRPVSPTNAGRGNCLRGLRR